MRNVLDIFDNYVKEKGLKRSFQRELVVGMFAKARRHFTVEELYDLVKKTNRTIGYATVYRTMKLLVESGIANEFRFDDGLTRYELKVGHEHHDHLICKKCGKYIEVVDEKIEELQEKLAKKYNFKIDDHRMEIYGMCADCRIRQQ